MKCVILQPGYLPWLGFFDQMNWADTFVIYDDVQYTKRDWRSRNRIKTQTGTQWLSVAVLSKNKRHQLINEAKIAYDKKWNHKHIESITMAYSSAKYFEKYFPSIKEILQKMHEYLVDLNMDLIKYLKDAIGIQTDIVYSSKLKAEGKNTERLVNICAELGAKEYLTGDAARDYLDEGLFERNGIKLKYHNYKYPLYPQLHGEFIPYLSVIDLLFNCGPESFDYITGKRN